MKILTIGCTAFAVAVVVVSILFTMNDFVIPLVEQMVK